MSNENRTRLLPAVSTANRRDTAAGREGGVMLKGLLSEAFDQYVFDRVDHILNLADANDAGYSKTAREVSAALDRLLVLARALKAEHPELTGLVMDFEALTALESGQAAEISYKQGLRDSSHIHREFMTFLQQQYD
ncbi:hypothetical protein [Sporomusa termitida]|nr:hypothetical protein [Sporomusa termitida]